MDNTRQDVSFKSLFVPLTTLKAINIIIILGLVVFFNSLFNGFVWDDNTYLINNPEIHTFNLEVVLGKNLFNYSGFYRPIPALYFAGLYTIFSTMPFFY